jgi:hypothetical protein
MAHHFASGRAHPFIEKCLRFGRTELRFRSSVLDFTAFDAFSTGHEGETFTACSWLSM